MDDNQLYTIILRHDTSTQWAVNNPILTLGEYGVEDDTHRVKRGDGETEWNDLPYEEFGLTYLVTYENLSGEVSDNEALQEALDEKMSIAVFEDVNYQTVSSLDVTEIEGAIGKITKIYKNINTSISGLSVILIKSEDKSISGYWSVDDNSVRILNLKAECAISDYQVGHMYYQNHLCFYKNKLYRAVENFEAEVNFNESHWAVLASLHSNDIKYDNLISGLEADNVKDALDELQNLDSKKVKKTSYENKIYGTNSQGQQYTYDKDELHTVDSVNGVRATDQELKNIQIDASDINYDDEAQEPETIKEKLDQKVDKTVAGVGAKIVRDVRFNYNAETGHITLIEDKVSLEDGSSDEDEVEVDVVSEQELSNVAQAINDRIDDEVTDLNDRIDDEVADLNTRINNEVTTLNNTISNLNTKVDNQVIRLDGRIDNAVNDYTAKVNHLTQVVADNKTDIEGKLLVATGTLNNRIDSEVLTLNNRINTEVDTLNDRIDTEVETLNETIGAEVETLNDRIDGEVTDLHTYIDTQDDLKIDKDIADNLVTLLDVATHDSQPTIRITNKNTQSKQATYDYVHFGTQGLIQTRMADADHLIIDSTAIDTVNTQQNARLTNAENRLSAHDTSIASLLEHDVNHDRTLATHTSQIADHETRMLQAEADIDNLETALDNEITNRTTADAGLSARIADNAVRIANNTQAIRDNADSIDQLAQTLEENVEALTNSKVDKDFAENINNKLVGKLESDTIANTELINLKKTMISPIDGSTSIERIKIISSDNTVIATRQADGTIDLATNLDTDVNYFVTTEIISTTIAAETTLDMTQLTPTDKQEVEVQDIITDPEGTWGRVKAIDTTNNECTVVTFKRHAQAVWGTIKGTLADQQDLQTILDDLYDTKVDKTNNADKVYGTDSQGNQTTYDKDSFGKVDTVNNVQADNNKNVTLDGSNINVDNTEVTPISIKDMIEMLVSDLQNQVVEYTTGASYTVSGNYVSQNYVTHERYDGVMLMGRVVRDFISDTSMQSTYDSFQKDVEDGNIVLVGIPEQDGTTPSHSGDVIIETFNDIEPEGNNSLQVALSYTPAEQSGENPTQYLDFNGSELGENMVATISNVDGEWDGGEQTISSSGVATFSTTSTLKVDRSYVSNNFSISYEESQDDYAEVMDILNDVDGVQDSYDGLGGTEEEVADILDEILGNA